MPIFKRWKHPNMPGTLTTEETTTPEEVIENYAGDDVDPALLQVESVEMTEAEFDALPEFQG